MKMNSNYPLALILAAGAMLVASPSLAPPPIRDSRIETSAAASSYVFKTYLKNDSIKTESKDGAVTADRNGDQGVR